MRRISTIYHMTQKLTTIVHRAAFNNELNTYSIVSYIKSRNEKRKNNQRKNYGLIYVQNNDRKTTMIQSNIDISFDFYHLDPCVTDKFLSNENRSVSYNDSSDLCDSNLNEGWYRITSCAGEKMPTQCTSDGYQCGTASPLWLSNSQYI